MAGHSKWANIQHRKGKQDAIRSKMFSKLSKEITVAAKMGDPDPDKNPRLRLAVKAAKAVSMPKDVIDRAIKKSQMGDAADYVEIRYEGYGAGGIAIFPVMFFGKGAFKVVNPEGAGMETIVKTKQQIGGPLEQYSTVGGKFSGAAKIVYPERLVTLECASAYSATAEAN